MTNQDLYLKKLQAIAARKKLEQHGISYDNTSTACFAFILLAIAVSIAGFIFMILDPGNPSQIIIWVAYIGTGVFVFFVLLAIVVRMMQKHSRKPFVQEKKYAFDEYEQAVRSMLKYDYGLIPVDDYEFSRKLYLDTLGDTDSFVIKAMSLDGQEKINLTLKETDEDSLIFTKYGVPYHAKINMGKNPPLGSGTIPETMLEGTVTLGTPQVDEGHPRESLQIP